VSAYQREPDYANEVEESFAKFREEAPTDNAAKLRSLLDMSPVEAKVPGLVARLHPVPFSALAQYFGDHQQFMAPEIVDFERAAQFYLAYSGTLGP
jgi:hypothetical protein